MAAGVQAVERSGPLAKNRDEEKLAMKPNWRHRAASMLAQVPTTAWYPFSIALSITNAPR